LPDGTTTIPGTVASVGRVASVPNAAANGAAGGAGSSTGQGSGSAAAIPVTITIARSGITAGLDQAPVQVQITEQEDRNVLAVPVTALLATPGGGYAVRVSGQSRRLIPVTVGVFDDTSGLVEVSGPGLAVGLSVEVAQG
jgi:hypothetical protein